jgi:hypothetical protein
MTRRWRRPASKFESQDASKEDIVHSFLKRHLVSRPSTESEACDRSLYDALVKRLKRLDGTLATLCWEVEVADCLVKCRVRQDMMDASDRMKTERRFCGCGDVNSWNRLSFARVQRGEGRTREARRGLELLIPDGGGLFFVFWSEIVFRA